jgi:hypothetical protein
LLTKPQKGESHWHLQCWVEHSALVLFMHKKPKIMQKTARLTFLTTGAEAAFEPIFMKDAA